MILLSRKLWLWSFVAVLGLVVYLVSCDGKATQFQHVPDDPKDYRVYFCDPEGTPQLFIYHPVTRHVDSIEIPWSGVRSMTASADGQRLYLTLETSVIVVDAESLMFIAELTLGGKGAVAVSPDGQLLATGSGGGLVILDGSDYSVVFQDTAPGVGVFSSNSQRFYGSTETEVYKLDLSDTPFSITTRTFPDGSITSMIPSPDETKWFLYVRIGTFASVFRVYDVPMDSIIFSDWIMPGYGQIAITPDGRYVFYSNPGRDAVVFPRDLCFTVFDVEANKIDRVVSDTDFFTGPSWVAPPNRMAITPDGRWLVMLGGSLALRVLYLYDIQTGLLVHREDWGGSGHIFTNVTVQNAM